MVKGYWSGSRLGLLLFSSSHRADAGARLWSDHQHQLCRWTEREFWADQLCGGKGRDYWVYEGSCIGTAKKGITVNAIAPGFVKTAMTEKIPKDVMDKIVGSIPVGRLAEPSEIARAIVFLSDEKSSYITGQVMGINGGFYM